MVFLFIGYTPIISRFRNPKGSDNFHLNRGVDMRKKMLQSPISNLVLILAMLISSFASLRPTQNVQASHTANPTNVTVAGSLQSELGCSGDWQPDCANTHLG